MPRRPLIAATVLAVLLPAAPARADWVWPVRGEVITPYRNGGDPYAAGQHRGIDIAAGAGTPVVAAVRGEVRFAGTAGSSGLTVSVRSDDGLYDTSYLHLSSTAVRSGQPVAAGERLGAVGTTGVRSAQQPHLHFGVRDAGSRHDYRDPLAFLPPVPAAPEAPRARPAPSPTPVPVMPRPAPEPIRIQAPRRVPAPGSAPSPRSAPRRLPIPGRAPRHVTAGRAAPHAHPAPLVQPAPLPRLLRVPHGRRAPHSSPRPGGVLATQPAPSPHAARSGRVARGRPVAGARGHPAPLPLGGQEHAPPAGRTADGPGPDLGYALACAGLLVAAALLGLSEDGRKATRRSRDRVAGFLRPLAGRR